MLSDAFVLMQLHPIFFDAAASSDGDFGSQQRLQQQEGGEEHLATMGQGPGTPVFLPNKPIF